MDITGCISIPEFTQENCKSIYYEEWETVSQDYKKMYRILIDVSQSMIHDLILKNFEQKVKNIFYFIM